jgi:glycerate dehydrogenase
MKIVVLDGHTLNPGDLDWKELRQFGDCEIHDRTSPGELPARTAGAQVILTNKVVLNRATLEQLPQLQYIGVLATGFNVVDVAAARERRIPVCNVPDYSTRSVAQLTWALLLELTHQVGHHSRTVREGKWSRQPDFCYWDFPLRELDGLTFGLVGFGRIGREVARLAQAFGLHVLVHTRTPPTDPPVGIQFVPLEEVFLRSDIVSLHCPLTPATQSLINADRLALMKPGGFLLNTSRGPLVDESALAAALESGRLAGAAVDVLSVEPPPASNPLLTAKNCLVTPHLGWATRSARSRLLQIAIDNLKAFRAGNPSNVVN